MKTTQLRKSLLLAAAIFFAGSGTAQVVFSPVFTQIRLEARADFDYQHVETWSALTDPPTTTSNPYGFHGKYFNFVVGGDLNDKFSYFFRQRIIAQPGHVSLFDNTDFLYLTYHPNKNWMFRLGKDALAVGGFEYDAAPIDVLFSTNYWDNFYCFQLGGAAAYKSNDGNHMILAQVANSPYVYYGAALGTALGQEWRTGLLAYSLFWSGKFGHFNTLYSVNMFERPDHGFMNYIALGNKLIYDRWDVYYDLIHHALDADDWGKNFAAVFCFNFHLTKDFNIYGKCSYEQNHSEVDFLNTSGLGLDCLIPAGHSYAKYGFGFEYNPSFCKDVRLHGVLSYCRNGIENAAGAENDRINTVTANIGITWHMNIHRMFMERGM
ncbi:MAG: OprO/OprP family phosphate-selective porin [Bacteroidales bacterium]|nr:OprO/OprP family phosphate-selective porin [Bacteroidales bacterium]